MNTSFLATLVGCVALLAVRPNAQQQAGDAPTQRPNILFILVDDQSPFDLKVYDKESACRTPVLEQRAEGTLQGGREPYTELSIPQSSTLLTGPHQPVQPPPICTQDVQGPAL